MKLIFSIDALSPAADKAWRLQTNETWRVAEYSEPLKDSDMQVLKPAIAEAWLGRRMKKDDDLGLIAQQKTGIFDFFSRSIYTHAVMHRLSDAPIPDKHQMVEVVASLTVGIAWLLYLNPAGQFTALDSNNAKIIGNLDIAVRGEIASSEHYIGSLASENDELMEATYRQFLEAWLEHLNTSKMSLFVPDVEKLNEKEDVLAQIQQWQHE
ncbi:MAG: hypothetical protein COA61_000260 [Zetaproteobacteria bacterium]|nr:hypothetical protein [Zetaproteobacteria bacterium]